MPFCACTWMWFSPMYQLVYALVFLVAHCQGRTSYPAEGWSNSNYIFTDSDLEVPLTTAVFSQCALPGWTWAPWYGDGEGRGRDQLPRPLLPSHRVQPASANQRHPRPKPANSYCQQVKDFGRCCISCQKLDVLKMNDDKFILLNEEFRSFSYPTINILWPVSPVKPGWPTQIYWPWIATDSLLRRNILSRTRPCMPTMLPSSRNCQELKTTGGGWNKTSSNFC